MKIVNLREFVRMPVGTIFAPYTPNVIHGTLEIKMDEGSYYKDGIEDWSFIGTCEIIPNTIDFEYGIGDGAPVDYLDEESFVIFEENDIDNLINILTWAKNKCEGICNVPGMRQE